VPTAAGVDDGVEPDEDDEVGVGVPTAVPPPVSEDAPAVGVGSVVAPPVPVDVPAVGVPSALGAPVALEAPELPLPATKSSMDGVPVTWAVFTTVLPEVSIVEMEAPSSLAT
jgi:hypothetical protein